MSREDLTAIVKEEIVCAADYLGMHPTLAGDLARQVEDRLRLRVGGSDLKYIAKLDRVGRDRKIKAEFTGDNLEEVSKRHGVSTRHARRIIFGG